MMLTAVGPQLLYFLGAAGLAVFLGLYKIASLTKSFALTEITTFMGALKLKEIFHDPINAPYKLSQYLLAKWLPHTPITVRLTSIIIMVLSVGLFYYVLRQWHTHRISALTTLMFGTSAWLLHVGRVGKADITQLSLLSLLAIGLWLMKRNGSLFGIVVATILLVFALYVPGLVWFCIPPIIWQKRRIFSILKNTNITLLSLIILIFTLSLLPLFISFVSNSAYLLSWLNLPSHQFNLFNYFKSLLQIPVHLFVTGPDTPIIWLKYTPVIDIFTGSMAIIGIYNYFHYRKLDRSIVLSSVFIIGSFLLAFNESVSITILLPFIYILVASGMTLLLQQWFTVFPKNPFAKNIGYTLISIVVGVSIFYNLTNYFVAWPRSIETKKTFIHNL